MSSGKAFPEKKPDLIDQLAKVLDSPDIQITFTGWKAELEQAEKIIKEKNKEIERLRAALKFYASKKTWKKSSAWTGSAGFGEESDDRQEYDYFPILEKDRGKIATKALAGGKDAV